MINGHEPEGALLPKSRTLAGVPIALSTAGNAADTVVDLATRHQETGTSVHFVNAYTISLAYSDANYKELLQEASLNYPDGKPLTWATYLSSMRLHQVRGPRTFLNVMDRGRDVDLRHFLLGGSNETLERLEKNLKAKFPGVQIVGSFSPPFRTMTEGERNEQDASISRSRAQVVWVGLGTPKQDYEVQRLSRSLPVVACAVGAAFDFMAGTKKEAPRWVTAVGFEWLYRLATEPRRLWRRYLIGNLVFIRAITTRG